MAYDRGLAQLFRDDLYHEDYIEKKMFGGLCFMVEGHMTCGVNKDGGMARVGADMWAQALEMEGVEPMTFTKRRMIGFVDINAQTMANDDMRQKLVAMALKYVRSLPPKM